MGSSLGGFYFPRCDSVSEPSFLREWRAKILYRYGACLGTNQFTVPTELFPNHLRAFASGVAISCIYLIQVLWLNVGPLALQRVSWRFYCTFISLGFCGIFFVYFFVPEVGQFFNDGVLS